MGHMIRTHRSMGKGGATVDTQAEVIIIEQGEAGAREHTGVTWDQRSDGRGGGRCNSGAACLPLNIPI